MTRTVFACTLLLFATAAFAEDARPSMPFYGTATMDADGGLSLHLTRTDDGKAVDTTMTFAPGSNAYDSVRRHLGIAPGETRPVTPWKD
jgi:hypothetical protein